MSTKYYKQLRYQIIIGTFNDYKSKSLIFGLFSLGINYYKYHNKKKI